MAEKDKQKEVTLQDLLVLAEGGQSRIQHAVGVYYENGLYTEVDYKEAARWYEKAAAQGNGDSRPGSDFFMPRDWG